MKHNLPFAKQRYALTFMREVDNWDTVDTIIVELRKLWTSYRPVEQEKIVRDILQEYGLTEQEARVVVDFKNYYIRNTDDVDIVYKGWV